MQSTTKRGLRNGRECKEHHQLAKEWNSGYQANKQKKKDECLKKACVGGQDLLAKDGHWDYYPTGEVGINVNLLGSK
jgi:hypothetical protein